MDETNKSKDKNKDEGGEGNIDKYKTMRNTS